MNTTKRKGTRRWDDAIARNAERNRTPHPSPDAGRIYPHTPPQTPVRQTASSGEFRMWRGLAKWAGLGLKRRSKTDRALSLRELRAAGDAARDRRRWGEAARFYEEVIKIDASDFDIDVQLGHAYKEMGNYDRAAELYFSTLTHRPDNDDLHLQIGHLEKIRGNFVKAMHHYKEAVDLNSKNSDARREYQALLRTEKAHSDGETAPVEDPFIPSGVKHRLAALLSDPAKRNTLLASTESYRGLAPLVLRYLDSSGSRAG